MRKFTFKFIDGETLEVEGDSYVVGGAGIVIEQNAPGESSTKIVAVVSTEQLKYWTVE